VGEAGVRRRTWKARTDAPSHPRQLQPAFPPPRHTVGHGRRAPAHVPLRARRALPCAFTVASGCRLRGLTKEKSAPFHTNLWGVWSSPSPPTVHSCFTSASPARCHAPSTPTIAEAIQGYLRCIAVEASSDRRPTGLADTWFDTIAALSEPYAPRGLLLYSSHYMEDLDQRPHGRRLH
jgi:hypothetical protein